MLSGVPEKMYGTLCLVSADNPASSALGGFKETTSAYRPCRQCTATRLEMDTKFRARDFTLKTPAMHSHQLQLLENSNGSTRESISREYGINYTPVLNNLQYFDVTSGSLIPDIMHDVLEGVLQYEAKLLLQQIISSDHYCTLVDLNNQIESIELGYSEVKSRPSLISTVTFNEKDGSLKQSGK